jgi:hypothetical protein
MSEQQKQQLRHTWLVLLQHLQASGAVHTLTSVAALLASGLLLSAFSAVPDLLVFGHDEVHYYQDMSDRLPQDGRWINLLLHDFLRSIPPATWACIFMATAWLLFYRIARSLAFDKAYAVLITSTLLLAYPFAEQVLWPATAMPALLIVLVASLAAERGIPHPPIYLLSGMLIFGTLQTLYFLLPLLFLPQFLPTPGSTERRWILLFNHMCWWVAGSVAGVLLMSLFIWMETGSFGPQPAEWRLTTPIEDVSGLIRNIRYVSSSFIDQLEILLRKGGVTWTFIAVVALAVLLRGRALLAMPHLILLLAAVLLSFFAFSIPLAPQIHQRSLIAMAAAVVLFMALFPGSGPIGRIFATLLLLKLGHGFSVSDETYIANRMSEGTYFYKKLEALMPGHPLSYSAIALYGSMPAERLEARVFNDPTLIHAVVIAVGATKYLDCRLLDTRCDPVGAGRQLSSLPFADGQLQFSVDENNVGIIRYLQP